METRVRNAKRSRDAFNLLEDALLRQVVQFIGKDSYRGVAGTCNRFGQTYRQVFETRTTSAEEFVQTVSGAELFCAETSEESRFRIKKKEFLYTGLNVYSPLEFVRDAAILKGRLQVLEWAFAQDCPLRGMYTCALAAFSGNLSMLQWARANDCHWTTLTCAYAALNGHLEVLQWARANGCPWDSSTCYEAAKNGHLEVLQWARANGCPWDILTCFHAARGGHLELLQWARANGCPWESSTCSSAAQNGHLEVLQWARANGCPWGTSTCYEAAKNGHLEVLQWARGNGCPEEFPLEGSLSALGRRQLACLRSVSRRF